MRDFHLPAIVNDTTVNTRVHFSLRDPAFRLGVVYLELGLLDHMVVLFFKILRICRTVFHGGCAPCYITNNCAQVS